MMWSDMLTKPLQEQQFRQMRAMVMNCPLDYEKNNYYNKSKTGMMMHQDEPETSSQECVGKVEEMSPMVIRKTDRQKIDRIRYPRYR